MIDFNDITEWFQKIYKKSLLLIEMVVLLSLSTKHIRNTNQLFAIKEMNFLKLDVEQWRLQRQKGGLGGIKCIFTLETL